VLRSYDLGGGMHIVKKPFLIDILADEVWNLLNI
jgi:hypothetical protein